MEEPHDLPAPRARLFGLPEASALAGIGLVVAGVALIHVPTALIVAGLALVATAIALARL
ncbi:hypothetical protein [Methylobacterium nodulans]|uniref:Uncharacterized protein n=1 Tax=Methylobacterium nodulans (strain LMG 21967 / CNCM I-2342 / ORS 2060) TaxID=460265 RepID=B8IT96_METNO|nr:hypothetical protein [Methylobacterium nodulans]ACL56982.1 hypothetical protein Mnod_1995 [Methylobacterium nodulans ORS 2060]